MSDSPLTEAKIHRLLQRAWKNPLDDPYPETFFSAPPEPAAVLLPFLVRENGWHILFIRRTINHHDRHGGQVAFPGGRSDPEDQGARDTALREAHEEIGLPPNEVKILGELNAIRTITNYLVTPLIGVVRWPTPLRLAPGEVSRAFTIPLNWLAEPANHFERERYLPSPYTKIRVTYFHPFDGELLWGASARIVMNLISALCYASR